MTKHKVENTYIIACLLVLSFVAYMCFTHNMPTRVPDAQGELYADVPFAKAGPPPVATPVYNGDALAYMQIPRFGDDWNWVTLEGVSLDILDQGPGHYPGTALPGDEGNASFAAHRASHGDPFIDFDTLKIGDKVILAQNGAEWTYEITQAPVIIPSDANWVTDVFAPGKWLTLTTCWPKYGSSKRMYIRAKLSSAEELTVQGR